MEEKKITKLPNTLILKERKALNVSGILEVDSFDESTVIVYTELGGLTIRGQGLHINKIDLENGGLELEGNIASLEYIEDKVTEKGFFSKLFR